jgi:hypothetical protein
MNITKSFDNERLRITGHKEGLFGYAEPTIDSKEYTKRMKLIYNLGFVELLGSWILIIFLMFAIIILMNKVGVDHLSEVISPWIIVPIIIIFAVMTLTPMIWMLHNGVKNNWTKGLKK